MLDKIRTVLISDFNIEVLGSLLKNDPQGLQIDAQLAAFGQVHPTLHHIQDVAKPADGLIIWTQPQAVIPSFQAVLNYEPVSTERMSNEVNDFVQLIHRASQSVAFVLVVGWTVPTYVRGIGPGDFSRFSGINRKILEMNLQLMRQLETLANIIYLNPTKWIESVGKFAFNPKLWYMGKIPFDTAVFKEAQRDIKAAIIALKQGPRKVIILDLDQTLWGGVVGDVGWEQLKLGGHDPIGEAFVDFQKTLKAFKNRGILLAIVSKNDEAKALQAIKHHPEMVLRPEDFSAMRINWKDKAQNCVEIAEQLNLGLNAMVFIDDHPGERGRVREALPEIYVPEWPSDPMLFKKTFLELTCFDTISLTFEDQSRVQMYWDEQARHAAKTQLGSAEDWLKSLNIEVKIEDLNEGNFERAVQLLNKTNQMNLTTRRLTAQELKVWLQQPNHKMWTFRVSDKFGDSGLTGIASIAVALEEAHIVDFVLSCRVFGRQVEEVMLYTLMKYAAKQNVKMILAKYLPTPKNQPCLDFLKRSGMTTDAGGHVFVWDLTASYPCPEINLIFNS